jgi:hypothetical protein
MEIRENLTTEELFKEVLESEIILELINSTPLEKLIPYLFHKFFLKYGKGEMRLHEDYDNFEKTSLTFEINPELINGLKGFFEAKVHTVPGGNSIKFFSADETSNPSKHRCGLEIRYCAPTTNFLDKTKPGMPWVYVGEATLATRLGSDKDKFSPILFLSKFLAEEIAPLNGWVKRRLDEYISMYHS